MESLFSTALTADHWCIEACVIVFLHESNEWWDVQLVQDLFVGLWNDCLSDYDYIAVEEGVNEPDGDDFEW